MMDIKKRLLMSALAGLALGFGYSANAEVIDNNYEESSFKRVTLYNSQYKVTSVHSQLLNLEKNVIQTSIYDYTFAPEEQSEIRSGKITKNTLAFGGVNNNENISSMERKEFVGEGSEL